jgi:alpha-aminoadipic semialdehyde synthase
MKKIIGVRKEDKNIWERRTPIIPEHIGMLIRDNDLDFIVQPSNIRAFSNKEYEHYGAKISDDLSLCDFIFGVKEVPKELILKEKTYIFFAHVIKGQKYNMPMLKTILEKNCTLIDYERIVDKQNKRLVFFGYQAGQAGFMDGMWALGQRLDWEDMPNPFSRFRPAHTYLNLNEFEKDLEIVSEKIEEGEIPEEISPVVVGIAGYGHVSQGVQSLLNQLPFVEITPKELLNLKENSFSKYKIYKVVFKEEDMVEPINPKKKFDLQDYYDNPKNYKSIFNRYLPHLTILFNCIYWDQRYPRLVAKEDIKNLCKEGKPNLRVLADISCDVEGAIEVNVKTTTPGNPIYVWNVDDEKTYDGFAGKGPIVLAVDNLPCELPKESSTFFSRILLPFIPEIANCNWDLSFENLNLSYPLKKAVIVHKGELTPEYKYLERSLL